MNPILLISFIVGTILFLSCLIIALKTKDDDYGLVAFISLFIISPMWVSLNDQWERSNKQQVPIVQTVNTNRLENVK